MLNNVKSAKVLMVAYIYQLTNAIMTIMIVNYSENLLEWLQEKPWQRR
jgi:hypothetical protein